MPKHNESAVPPTRGRWSLVEDRYMLLLLLEEHKAGHGSSVAYSNVVKALDGRNEKAVHLHHQILKSTAKAVSSSPYSNNTS